MRTDKLRDKEMSRIHSDDRYQALVESEQHLFERMLFCSPWLAQWVRHQDNWSALLAFFESEVDPAADLAAKSKDWPLISDIQVMKDLRVWRNQYIARLIARDILGLNQVRETAQDVSDLADVALQCALRWSTAYWQEKDGIPAICPHSGEPEQLIVIAMGKHGARELNLSSDIDLIFAFPTQGVTSKGRSHEQFFTRVGQKIISLLDSRTSDGFVFRVDMRLRPWGQSGALASNFTALQNYYLQQGRFWERFAMVKARPVTGAKQAQVQLTSVLQPFVYRRYIDYQAVGALRELKAKIQAEVRRQNLERNIKLGRGGIREVEFIAQVFQLIRGGQDEVLQARGTWPILESIKQLGLLPATVIDDLVQSYDFLRDLEHRIQAINDEQTQILPVDDISLERLSLSANMVSSEKLLADLQIHRDRVNLHFLNLIADDAEQEAQPNQNRFVEQWLSVDGSNADTPLAHRMAEFRALASVEKLGDLARQNLDNFMPLLWAELDRYLAPVERFNAIQPILESILRRSSYFVLMTEKSVAIQQLVKLVPESTWIANFIQEKPFLLDELTDIDSLYRLPNRGELMDELHQTLLRVPEEDLERQMEILRHFRHGKVLRAAACEVTEHLPLMKISDYLAWVAEVVVEQAQALAWRQMIAKHGRPSKGDGDWCDPDFGVIAYGKMGGLELSYESDLDLVFLHNAAPQGMTAGPKSIENTVFMARLGQKLIHLLSAVTPSGMLYEVDTRLRPSGNSGLLVSSLPAFIKYQTSQAWTWEHQALVRARYIAGDPELKAQFDQFRAELICQERDTLTLLNDVLEMRKKMLDHLSTEGEGGDHEKIFHLKHDTGGIVDLEFLVQFLILSNAHQNPDLAVWSDNVRSITMLEKVGIIAEDEKTDLLDAYIQLRQRVHRSILSGGSNKIAKELFDEPLAKATVAVTKAWARYLGNMP